LQEYRDAGLLFRIIRSCVHEHADAPHSLALLRTRRERPGDRCAAKQRVKSRRFMSYLLASGQGRLY
jgi:hypothetical protein